VVDKVNNTSYYEGAALVKRTAFMAEQTKNRAQARQDGNLTVLDLGCGLGTVPFLLGSLGYQVIGVDLDADTIADCQQRNQSPNVTFIVGNAETLHLKQKFDVVIASEVIEHVPHPNLVVKTMAEHQWQRVSMMAPI